MKILITGAGGYIGSRVCYELMKDHEIIPIDNFYSSQIESINGNKILNIDIRDRKAMEKLMPFECVVHLAAISGVQDCEKNPDLAYEVNVLGTLNIAYLSRKYKIPLIFASSMAIFGDLQYFPVDEKHPRNPINFYGFTKYLGMENIKLLSKNNFPAYIFIMSNVYGNHILNGKKITKNTVINKFIESVKKNREMTVYKPGTQARNFIHVKDVALAYKLAVSKIFSEKGYKEFCMAGNESFSVLRISEMIKKYAKKYGYNSKIKFIENPRKETLVKDFSVDISRIKEIGFEPDYGIEKGIEEMFKE